MRIIGLITVAGLSLAAAAGQVPREDIRNTYTPSTNTHFQMPEYKTLAQWEARKQHLRKQILSAAGLMPMPQKTPLNPQIFGRMDRNGYSIEKVYSRRCPDITWAAISIGRWARSGKLPAHRFCRTGTGPTAGWRHQQLGSMPARCINLARQGYVVFAYDMVGYNDTIQTPHDFGRPGGAIVGLRTAGTAAVEFHPRGGFPAIAARTWIRRGSARPAPRAAARRRSC